jgi:putative SOS response-associated peptidase YedK
MCGRFTLTVSARLLAELFELDELSEFAPRYNIAPTQPVLIVRAGRESPREAAEAHWGLIPSWAKDRSMGARMINARSETAAAKPSFRSAMKTRRCLIAADGFYEWQKTAAGKQPHLIRFSDARPFAFAGLWERWHDPADEPLDSCTILTTSPNERLAELHDRMPVILPPEHFAEWLEPEPLPAPRLDELLVPHPHREMEAFPVSRHVNSPHNDDPKCIERTDPGLFA